MNNIQGSFPLSFCLCSGKARLMEATTFQSTASNLKPTHWLRLTLLLWAPLHSNSWKHARQQSGGARVSVGGRGTNRTGFRARLAFHVVQLCTCSLLLFRLLRVSRA